MYCSNCGKKLSNKNVFCPHCGQKVQDELSAQESSSSDEKNIKSTNIHVEQPSKIKGFLVVLSKIFFVLAILSVTSILVLLCWLGDDIMAYWGIVPGTVMFIAAIYLIAYLIYKRIYKITAFPKKKREVVFLIIILLLCFVFSIWSFIGFGQFQANLRFKNLYYEFNCNRPWAEYGESYLSIDTNPDDSYSDSKTYYYEAIDAIRLINYKLGIPDSVYERMQRTAAIDGMQYYYGNNITVSWSYHPNSGLEVMYYAY